LLWICPIKTFRSLLTSFVLSMATISWPSANPDSDL
jgi:hypothetical protein